MHASILFLTLLVQSIVTGCTNVEKVIGLEEYEKEPTPPKLDYLLSLFATETPAIVMGNTGHGTRIFIPITGGVVSGPRVQGKVVGVGGDWGHYNADHTVFTPIGKTIFETDDGASILLSAYGRSPYITYVFETGDERYAWINAVVGVGIIHVGDNNITTDIFQHLSRNIIGLRNSQVTARGNNQFL